MQCALLIPETPMHRDHNGCLFSPGGKRFGQERPKGKNVPSRARPDQAQGNNVPCQAWTGRNNVPRNVWTSEFFDGRTKQEFLNLRRVSWIRNNEHGSALFSEIENATPSDIYLRPWEEDITCNPYKSKPRVAYYHLTTSYVSPQVLISPKILGSSLY